MGPELVTIQVGGGGAWSGFESITVNAAFDEAARDFTFKVAAEAGARATNAIFQKGTEVSILFNGQLVLKGAVNRKQPKLEGESAEIVISGRSLSQDLIDSSAEHETNNFKKKDPLEIGNEVSKKIKAKFTTDQKLEKKDQYKTTIGESVFRCVEKLCREQGLTITGAADGNALITKAGSKRHAGGLIQGANIKSIGADHNDSNQHSEITVRGQRPIGHGAEALELESVIRESGLKRHRPLVVVQDSDTNKDLTKKRAKNLRDRKAGDALKATVVVQGFRDDAGKIWEPGYLVWTESEFCDIAQDMLIERVSFQQQEGEGSLTTISLTDPRSYGGKGGKGNKSGSEWSQSDSDAE